MNPSSNLDADSNSNSSEPPKPESRRLRIVLTVLGVALATGLVWQAVGRDMANQFGRWREESRAAEDNAPVGYLGLNYRRSYNDRAPVFFTKKDGRTTLFAAKRGGGEPDDVYDVTDASVDLSAFDGGFGRDSIPGIDYPIVETPQGARGKNLRTRQDVYGLELQNGPRAYPRDLLEKIETINDVDGDVPILIVYDRGRAKPFSFRRAVDGATVTFGTTGYSRFKQPVLYDRKTKSIWILENDAFLCVAGPSKGRSLEPFRPLTATTWDDWLGRHSKTTVVVGNDRSKPIPAE